MFCVGRMTEIGELFKTLDAIGIDKSKVAVLTSDEKWNALGSPADPTACQVLITTQQRIEQQCRGSFEAAKQFFYNGRPRAVRVWDEGWLPGAAVTLNPFDLAALMKPLMHRTDLSEAMVDLFLRLRGAQDGELVAIPDWEDTFGLTLHDALRSIQGASHEDQQAMTTLFILAGRMARVSLDGPSGNAVLTYQDTLPADLLPLLVLDASGRVRQTYRGRSGPSEDIGPPADRREALRPTDRPRMAGGGV